MFAGVDCRLCGHPMVFSPAGEVCAVYGRHQTPMEPALTRSEANRAAGDRLVRLLATAPDTSDRARRNVERTRAARAAARHLRAVS